MRLIDADALKKHYSWWNDGYKEIFDNIIDQQPTIEERKKGKWRKAHGAYYERANCSNCGNYYPIDPEFPFNNPMEWNFCPNCGADMREET